MSSHKPSKLHPNRKLHNWLMYDVQDKFLISISNYFNGIVYDLGCGRSPYKAWLLKYFSHYVGVDWESSVHDGKPDITADLSKNIPVNDNVADVVLSLSVLEHLPEPQVMLDEAYRILKPGGLMVLQVPWQWGIHEAPHDFFRYTPFGLTHLLNKAGFINVQVSAQTGFFSMLAMKLNYFSRKIIRGPRYFRLPLLSAMVIPWCVTQLLAPLLDKLDPDWAVDTTGYFVTAWK